MAIIAISGRAGHGKDLVGAIIQYLVWKDRGEFVEEPSTSIPLTDFITNPFLGEDATGWKIVKFADKLKDIVCLLLGCTREQLEDREFKEKELGEEWWYYKGEVGIYPYDTKIEANKKLPLIKPTPRMLLQQIGTDLFRKQLHPNIWVNTTMADFRDYNSWIITDCRFPNELEAIKLRKGITIRINRPCEECCGTGYHKMDCSIGRAEHMSEVALDNEQFGYVIENTGTIEELVEKVKEILIKENILIE